MPGVGLVNTPIVPRTWFLLSPVGSQLKPTRGDQYMRVFGVALVLTAGRPAAMNAAAILSFCTGVVEVLRHVRAHAVREREA